MNDKKKLNDGFKGKVTMHYEDHGEKQNYWVILECDGQVLFKFPYENMRHYADLYRMRSDAREFVLFWAKMIQNPD